MFQSGSPFDLPAVAALGAAVGLPAKIAVDVIKGAVPRLTGDVLPLVGVVLAFGIALLSQLAVDATFTTSLYAQCALAALVGQGGAMTATAMQNRANAKAVTATLEAIQGKILDK